MLAATKPEPARKPPPQAGDRYASKYTLSRRLAVGGMGEIWVSRNEMTGADVALKILRGDLERREETEARFRHEAKLGATLSHRNIVRVFDLLIEPDGTLILVMELLRGVTLRRAVALRPSPYNGAEAVAILLPILSALQHAHDNGIVHRDLKPANILLAVDPDGHVTPKLLDFGIAKVAGSGVRTMFGRVLGTPRYMSPEQIRADPKIDGRSDVFSAAILLIEMLTGSSPFRATTPSASLAAVLEQEVDPDPRIDPRLWLVIRRALVKRPYERYASASEFASALRQAIGLSDAELTDVLQRCAPPTSGTPSYSDISPGFTTAASEDDDDDDDMPAPAAPLSDRRGQAAAMSPSGRPVANVVIQHTPSGAPTAVDEPSISLPGVGTNRRTKWLVGLGASVALLAVAVVGISASGKKPTKPTTATTATATETSLPSNIPPPDPTGEPTTTAQTAPQTSATVNTPGDVEFTQASSAKTASKTNASKSSGHGATSKADKTDKTDKTGGKTKPVATKPDF